MYDWTWSTGLLISKEKRKKRRKKWNSMYKVNGELFSCDITDSGIVLSRDCDMHTCTKLCITLTLWMTLTGHRICEVRTILYSQIWISVEKCIMLYIVHTTLCFISIIYFFKQHFHSGPYCTCKKKVMYLVENFLIQNPSYMLGYNLRYM